MSASTPQNKKQRRSTCSIGAMNWILDPKRNEIATSSPKNPEPALPPVTTQLQISKESRVESKLGFVQQEGQGDQTTTVIIGTGEEIKNKKISLTK